MTKEERAGYVLQEYRVASAEDAAVRARNPQAQEVRLNSQMDQASAQALANSLLNRMKKPRMWRVRLTGIMFLDDFVGGPPAYIPNLPDFATDGRATVVTGYECDFQLQRTTVTVIG